MKHLRKIFESTKEDQKDEIEDIFIELLDQTYAGEDGEYYSNCEIDDRDNFMIVNIYDSQSKVIINSVGDYDKFTKELEERTESLKKLKKYLQRIDYAGFTWAMEVNSDGYFIQVYYKETKLTLIDAFGGEFGHKNFVETIAKRVFKEVYGLDYSSFAYNPSTSGYYGKKATYCLYFSKPIPNDSKLISDLKSLKQKYKYYGSDGEGIDERRIIYKVELLHDGTTLKIEIQ